MPLVYISTDAHVSELQQLKDHLKNAGIQAITLPMKNNGHDTYHDGSLAIIDQIICSHARLFIGTYGSTFTIRIQEEREIMGFPIHATNNIFCADNSLECEKSQHRPIIY